jgi:hypothetical protein
MRRPTPDLGRRLLSTSVRRLTAGRDHCRVCRRTPLVGERVDVYADGHVVCALCRDEHAGEPERTEVVRHSELGHAVKPAVRIAA